MRSVASGTWREVQVQMEGRGEDEPGHNRAWGGAQTTGARPESLQTATALPRRSPISRDLRTSTGARAGVRAGVLG